MERATDGSVARRRRSVFKAGSECRRGAKKSRCLSREKSAIAMRESDFCAGNLPISSIAAELSHCLD
jgi:hypothetical protein